MKIEVTNGVLYVDKLQFCFAWIEDADVRGRAGRFPVEARFSHAHGSDLIHADGFGWLGATRGCNAVLGRVRTNDGVHPCQLTADRLLAAVETAGDRGETVTLEVY